MRYVLAMASAILFAPLVAGVLGALALTALLVEVRRGSMTALTVAHAGAAAPR